MAELLTFGKAKVARELLKVSGCCSDSDEFKSLLNQSTRKLMNRGPGDRAWWGSVQRMQVCVYNNCITWPRWVGTPIAVNFNGRPMPMRNSWFDFMPFSRGDWNVAGGFQWAGGCCRGNVAVVNGSTSPVFRNIQCGSENYIRVYPQSRQDVGAVITIFGIDSNGQEIRTLRSDGTFQDGVDVTVALPYASTPMRLRTITRVVKPVTQNVLRLYQYDPSADVLLECATYYASETCPSYRTSTVKGLARSGNCSQQACNGLSRIDAMVKLEFVPVEEDNDLVLISNIDAIALMMQSIRALEGESPASAVNYEAAAVHEMNLQLEDKIPTSQTTVEIAPFGTAVPARASIGRII